MMDEIVVPSSIVVLLGLFTAIFAASRVFRAHDAKSRRRAMFSLLGSIIMIAIAISAVYLFLYQGIPRLVVVLTSGIVLVLNYLAFGRYSKPE
jgi:ABC-type xylose transport system permease subunit